MKRQILKILLLFFVFFISCECKKDVIEIYLTKNKIESYDGVPLRVAIKDSIIIDNVIKFYGEEIRIDTAKNESIFMGHFYVEKKDLETKPFINDSEILGIDFENSEIHFKSIVSEKIYNAIPEWRRTSFFGKQFVLCHNGQIIMTGYLLGSMSKFHSNTYQIRYHNYSEQNGDDLKESVVFSINDSLIFEKNNLRKNEDLYQAFKNRLIN